MDAVLNRSDAGVSAASGAGIGAFGVDWGAFQAPIGRVAKPILSRHSPPGRMTARGVTAPSSVAHAASPLLRAGPPLGAAGGSAARDADAAPAPSSCQRSAAFAEVLGLSFPGYKRRLPRPIEIVEVGQAGRESHVVIEDIFLSLAHFFEAQKFASHRQDLFRRIVHCPTVKEARKIAFKHQAAWREDWAQVRARALTAGLMFMAWHARPDPDLMTASEAQVLAYLEPLELPAKFLQQVAQQFALARQSPQWLVMSADGTPPEVVGRRLNEIHRQHEQRWALAFWMGRHVNWRVHDWAMRLYVPIRYYGVHQGTDEPERIRLSPPWLDSLSQASTKVCLFDKRSTKSLAPVVDSLKRARIPIDIHSF